MIGDIDHIFVNQIHLWISDLSLIEIDKKRESCLEFIKLEYSL